MRGYYGIGVFHSKSEYNIGTLMRSAFAFGAHFVFTINKRYDQQATDTCGVSNHVPLYHYKNFAELRSNLPIKCRLVGIEIAKEGKKLDKFVHPMQACYILGSEDGGLSREVMDNCHYIIEIPHTRVCLNVATAGSIVMYDRIFKGER